MLEVRYQVHNRGSHREVELTAVPAGTNLKIKFTTDGTSPLSTVARNYDGPFQIPADCRVIQAAATADQYQINSGLLKIPVDQIDNDKLKPDAKGQWRKTIDCQTTSAVFAMITKLEAYTELIPQTLTVLVESIVTGEDVDYSASVPAGIPVSSLDAKLRKFQEMFPDATVTMRITSLMFNRGDQLLAFLTDIQESYDRKHVKIAGE
jgi:hypothetical protein